MLRSQSIPDIHEKKSSSSSTTSKLFSAFKRSHNANTTTSSTEVKEKRKSRPLSTSISALNLKISSPILNSQQQQQINNISSPTVSDENKENINYATNTKQQRESKLKTRSSTPNLNRRSSAIFSHNRTSSIESQAQLAAAATARMLKTNNRLSFMGGNNFQVHNNTRTIAEDDNTHHHHHHHHGRHSSTTTTGTTGTSTSHISPATISSQSDSIFDQSSINCVGDEEEIEDGTSNSSELSSIHSTETLNEPLPSSNYIYSKQSTTTKAKSKSKSKNTATTTTIPESPSSSIISTSIPKKLHRTTNLYNLSEFINKLSLEAAAAQNGSDRSNSLVMLPIQQSPDQMISMNNRQSIEFENNQIKQLNQQLNQVDDYHCQVKLVENILFLTTTSATQTSTINGGASESEKSNRNGFEFDFDLDNEEYLDMLQNEAYNLESCSTTSSANSSVNNWFEADGDQLYLMY
ncbi:hypothetical protein I9W82_001416 [Candida metapsilosis]|uniref:Uncharacterized protein n=1 Tax=Candida metapsilosis TaxID=273372 RepID=A0A8H7ZKU0_9ASCO|nr:hypothetical protein I9W82_001416 [Candida metapsilosis]